MSYSKKLYTTKVPKKSYNTIQHGLTKKTKKKLSNYTTKTKKKNYLTSIKMRRQARRIQS